MYANINLEQNAIFLLRFYRSAKQLRQLTPTSVPVPPNFSICCTLFITVENAKWVVAFWSVSPEADLGSLLTIKLFLDF